MPDDPTGQRPRRGPRLDELPQPKRYQPGHARRAPDGALTVYEPAFPARPWRIVYAPDAHRYPGQFLSERETETWKDLVESGASASTLHVLVHAHAAAVRAARRENGRLSDALGSTRAQLSRAHERIRALERERALARLSGPGLRPASAAHAAPADPAPPTPLEPEPTPPVPDPGNWPPALAPGAAWSPPGSGGSQPLGYTFPPGIPLPAFTSFRGLDRVGARFAPSCRQVDGTWIHGRPHTCPPWTHQ